MPGLLGAIVLPSLAGTFTASVVGGALIGAAVGALTMAITGGDIFKGMLFGAVGGAVMGGVTHGIGVAMEGLKVGGSAVIQGETAVSSSGFWESAVASGKDVVVSGTGQVTQTVATATKGGGSSFLSGVGEWFSTEAGAEFGAAGIGAGIGGVKDVYMAGKQREFEQKKSDVQHARDMEKMAKANEYALQQIAGRGGGGGGAGGGGPDYTIDELIRRDREAAGQERTTVLAKVGAELGAQKELKGMDFAETAAARERATAGAGALKSAVRTGSRSTETLTDIQDRIRAGEDIEGNPNVGVDIPVEYVPPERVV